MNNFSFLKIYNSPFKRPRINIYFGKIVVGTPYFPPRRKVKSKTKDGWIEFKPKYFGFDFVDLGWKTKWSDTDYRHEWNPRWSFVFWKWQLAVIFSSPALDSLSAYWEAWLYYRYDTVGTTEQRVAQCKNENPKSSTSYPSLKHTNHYDEILKKKYL